MWIFFLKGAFAHFLPGIYQWSITNHSLNPSMHQILKLSTFKFFNEQRSWSKPTEINDQQIEKITTHNHT